MSVSSYSLSRFRVNTPKKRMVNRSALHNNTCEMDTLLLGPSAPYLFQDLHGKHSPRVHPSVLPHQDHLETTSKLINNVPLLVLHSWTLSSDAFDVTAVAHCKANKHKFKRKRWRKKPTPERKLKIDVAKTHCLGRHALRR